MLKAKGFIINLVLVTVCTFVTGQILYAQLHTLSTLHVSGNTSFTIPGSLNFAKASGTLPGSISTAKTGAIGFINFAEGSDWTGASDAQFINGYVKVLHNNPFVFPIGSDNKYRPIAISGGANTSAAYFDKSPAKLVGKTSKAKSTSTTSLDLQMIEKGYWNVSGKQSTAITLTWDKEAAIGALTEGEVANLRVLGLKRGKWEVIPSTVDKHSLNSATHQLTASNQSSNLVNGSISTTTEVIPNEYEYFTLGAVRTVVGETSFSVYPNPSLSRLPLNIAYELPEATQGTLKVYSALGSLLVERSISDTQGVITLSEITTIPGSYNVTITDHTGKTFSQQLIVVAE